MIISVRSDGYPDTTIIEYNQTLGCGACIKGNYIYCIKAQDDSQVYTQAPEGKCCQNADSCPEINDSNWTCSNLYSDKVFSYNICPFMIKSCGDSNMIDIADLSDL